MMRLAWLLALSWLIGCGGVPPSGTAPSPDGGSSGDGGVPVTGTWDLPDVTYTVTPGDPIAAPEEAWTFVSVPDAHCANGTSTGIAVNLTNRSKDVLIFLAGGGACWEAAACAAGTATHITDTMGETAVLAEAQAPTLSTLFDRNDPANPFRDASFVYVPYCTGDLHAGTQVTTYDWFGPQRIEHVGARNIDAYLRRLQPTFPDATRVLLSGISAGGYGAVLNAWRVQKAFPWAPVDVLNDSGLMVDVAGDGRYGTMQARWAMEFPPGCAECTTKLSAAQARTAELLVAPRRLATLGYLRDTTIGLYFGLQGDTIQAGLEAARASAPPNVKAFYLSGNQHVVLTTPNMTTSNGTSVRAWLQSFADLASTWDHAGP